MMLNHTYAFATIGTAGPPNPTRSTVLWALPPRSSNCGMPSTGSPSVGRGFSDWGDQAWYPRAFGRGRTGRSGLAHHRLRGEEIGMRTSRSRARAGALAALLAATTVVTAA